MYVKTPATPICGGAKNAQNLQVKALHIHVYNMYTNIQYEVYALKTKQHFQSHNTNFKNKR